MKHKIFVVVTLVSIFKYQQASALVNLSELIGSSNQPKPSTTHTANVELSSLITATAPKKIASSNVQSQFLSDFLAQQSNPWYQKALKILNDTSLRREYFNDVFAIQIFFLNYRIKVLSKIFSVNVSPKQVSLAQLLKSFTQPSAKKEPGMTTVGLSSLVSNISTGISANKKTVELSIDQLLSGLSVSKQPVIASTVNVNLQNLLDVAGSIKKST